MEGHAGAAWVIGTVVAVVGLAFTAWFGRGRGKRGEARRAAKNLKKLGPSFVDHKGSFAEFLVADRDPVRYDFRYTTIPATSVTNWLEDDGGPRLRLIWGVGGSGKTRLALQVNKSLPGGRWVVAQPREGADLARAVEDLVTASAGNKKNALLIVDYAESRPGLVEAAKDLAARLGTRCRILLLAREPGPWWDEVLSTTRLGSTRHDAEWEIKPNDNLGREEIRDIVEAVAREYAVALKVDLEGKPPRIEFGDRKPRPLELHMSALVHVINAADPRKAPPPLEVRDVLTHLAWHEKSQWIRREAALRDLHGGEYLELARIGQAIAAVNLLRPTTLAEAKTLIERALVKGTDVAPQMADLLASLYSGGDTIAPIQPDLFAEHLVLDALQTDKDLAGRILSPEAWLPTRQIAATITLLARAANDQVATSEELDGLGRRLEVVVAGWTPASVDDALDLDSAIPERVTVLRPLAASVFDRALTILDTQETAPSDLSDLLVNASVRFGEVGRREEGLAAIKRAVTVYEELAAKAPDAFLPDLAMSLNNLSADLGKLGRREEGLAASQRAVTIYEELAAKAPDAFLPDLAMSLNNLSVRLGKLGRRKEALAAIQRAVTIRENLAARWPEAFAQDLALSLRNAARAYRALGRESEALEQEEAARRVRGDSPDNE
ncbi:MAG: tetratricopeptide repeat protein [Micrococcales bacterium]|nr:tetratricopeptide repeat protein [Micrococcales bacterium]